MSADRLALLDHLRDEPDDVRLRMVYADWLEDDGQADRAEYVRLCYERSGLDGGEHADMLDARRAELFARHRAAWAAGLTKDASERLRSFGLVQRLSTSGAQFLGSADALRREPLSSLRLSGATRYVKKLAACAALADVRELAVFGARLDRPACVALAGSPHLGGLRTLRLIGCQVREEQAAILATAPWLRNVRTLDLGHYDRREDDPCNALWRNVGLSRVMTQGHTNHLGDEGFRSFMESPHLRDLEMLVATNDWVSPQSARLLWDGRFPKLRHLDLSYNYLGPAGLRGLVRSGMLRQLRTLEVQCNEVGDEAVAELAASPDARNLEKLDLSGALQIEDAPKLTSAAAQALAASPNLGSLRHLVLAFGAITAPGAEALAQTRRLPALRTLWLANNPLGYRGAKAFASSPLLGRLDSLDLSACGVTPGAAAAFARSKTAGDGLRLDLGLNALGAAAEALAARYGKRVTLVEPPDLMPF